MPIDHRAITCAFVTRVTNYSKAKNTATAIVVDMSKGTRMPLTDDPNDPCLNVIEDTGMQACYLILSDEERAKGFVRPVRTSYVHDTCGAVTTMGLGIAETYARQPSFYGGTFCASCGDHFRVGEHGEFTWDDGSGQKVGT